MKKTKRHAGDVAVAITLAAIALYLVFGRY